MLKIGIVGMGGMGTVHYNNYLYLEDCRVVGAVTRSPGGKAKAAGWRVPSFDTIRELVEHTGADLVDVCTPTYLHKDHVLQALEAGTHVIVEKPCALSRADAQSMYDLARAKGLHLYVAQVLQFSREVEVLRRLVEEQTYGKPLDALFQRLSARPDWAQGGWLFDREKSGLVPFDLHIHDLDVIVSLFGMPETMECRSCARDGENIPELYRWEYQCGSVNVAAEAGWLSACIPFTAVWRVYFERGAVIYNGQTVTAYPYGGEPVVFDTEDKFKIPTGINVPPTGWYLRELGHFVECIQSDKDSHLVPAEQVLAVLNLLEQSLQ